MPLVVGHSQTKYLSDYLCKGSYSVFSYSGYKTLQFIYEKDVFEVAPFFSVVVLVVGANDIGTKTPVRVFDDIVALCEGVHNATPSATIFLSELLPRARNRFKENGNRQDFIDHWNYDAGVVNKLLREFASKVPWVRDIEHPEFHTTLGANVNLLSKDGLHLTIDGTHTFTSNIETAVMSTHPTPTSEYGPVTYSSIVCKTQNKVCEPPRDSSTITATLTEKKRKRQRTYQDPSRTVYIGKFGCTFLCFFLRPRVY